MYTVFGGVASRAFRVLWALKELDQPFEHVAAAPRSEEILAHNPLGKIPALLDDSAVILDSVAIMTYLADKHGALTAPAGTAARGQQDAMTLWLIDELDATLWMAAKHRFVLPEENRHPEIIPFLKEDFAAKIDLLGDRMGGDFLMGDTITVPDILAVHCLNWSVSAKFPMENEVVAAYAKRLRSRDAFKAVRAMMPG